MGALRKLWKSAGRGHNGPRGVVVMLCKTKPYMPITVVKRNENGEILYHQHAGDVWTCRGEVQE